MQSGEADGGAVGQIRARIRLLAEVLRQILNPASAPFNFRLSAGCKMFISTATAVLFMIAFPLNLLNKRGLRLNLRYKSKIVRPLRRL